MSGDLHGAAVPPAGAGPDLYERLIADLQAARASYRLIDHAPEGRLATEDYLRLAAPRLAPITTAP